MKKAENPSFGRGKRGRSGCKFEHSGEDAEEDDDDPVDHEMGDAAGKKTFLALFNGFGELSFLSFGVVVFKVGRFFFEEC